MCCIGNITIIVSIRIADVTNNHSCGGEITMTILPVTILPEAM